MDLTTFLSSLDALAGVDDQDIAFLASVAELVEFPASTTVIKRGDILRFLWIMYDGEVEVSILDKDEKRQTIATLERGEIFGEMSIMTGEPAIADVVATAACKAVKIPRGAFSRVIAGSPSALGKVAKIITRRMIQREKDEEHAQRLSIAHAQNEDPYDLNFTSARDAIKILVLNCGSSSLKYSLFDTASRLPLFEGQMEKIGSGAALHKMQSRSGRKERPEESVKSMKDAFGMMIASLKDPSFGAIKGLDEIGACGHRVAHGGGRFESSVLITDEVAGAIRAFFPLAPLHNPFNLAGIETMQKLLPAVPQVAAFDTSFHHSIPDSAYTYALPYGLCETEQIRRYGFHGTNHRFVAFSAAAHMKRPLGELQIITCHLGNGSSVCAIDHGRSVDTSMGMTPLEGLVMGTRIGDVDAGAILHLMRVTGMSVDAVDKMLNKESGLKGISGKSNDMRVILQAAEAGDPRCGRAVGTFCYRAKKYIGSYMAVLGGLDALVFTGGMGENSAEIRARICHGLEKLGIILSGEINGKARARRGEVIDVSRPDSGIRVLVVPADEEKMIAREVLHVLRREKIKECAAGLGSMEIPLSVSAHHVHLSKDDFEVLFGAGSTLTPKAALSQPGQFAAEQSVNLIGPKGRVDRVRILGPFRKQSQVEISRTEEFKLGIDAPVRNSGDIEGTPGIIIEGEAGTLKLDKGVICARRHIHMSPEEALCLGLRDKDVVMVRVKGERELIFGDVLIRVHPQYKLDMHLDTDEANAAQATRGAVGAIESIQHRQYM
ncbi:MAG: acetate/propionate family kinase [Pseudomonadota bacterium]